jgi:hypothetical protein
MKRTRFDRYFFAAELPISGNVDSRVQPNMALGTHRKSDALDN